jgi:hypothetical protein
VPIVEKPAAASRLDNMIHQSNANDPSSNYTLAQVRQHERKQLVEPVLMEQHVVTSVHHNDDDDLIEPIEASDIQIKRSDSYSSSRSSRSSASTSVRAHTYDLTAADNAPLGARNSNLHRSLEVIPRKASETDQGFKPANKTASLQFGDKPGRFDDPGLDFYFVFSLLIFIIFSINLYHTTSSNSSGFTI